MGNFPPESQSRGDPRDSSGTFLLTQRRFGDFSLKVFPPTSPSFISFPPFPSLLSLPPSYLYLSLPSLSRVRTGPDRRSVWGRSMKTCLHDQEVLKGRHVYNFVSVALPSIARVTVCRPFSVLTWGLVSERLGRTRCPGKDRWERGIRERRRPGDE